MKPVSESVVPPSVSNITSLADPSSGPPSLLTTSNQTPLSALGHEDASSSSLAPQHNKYAILLLLQFSIYGSEMLIILHVSHQLPPYTAKQFGTFSSHFKLKSAGEFATKCTSASVVEQPFYGYVV